jgi:acetylornithine deacetylase/succinyl-diaminopimelate desuccinylase-like protein
MKDEAGTVTIQDFYAGVAPVTATEQAAIDAIPRVDEALLAAFGLARAEHPESRIELQHNLPTLSITGIEAGSVRAGAAAIPSSASARIGIRLVAGLNPVSQFERVVAHIRARGFHVVDGVPDAAARRQHALIASVSMAGASYVAAKTSMDDRRTAPVLAAMRSLGQPVAQLPTIGGGIPAFTTFSQTLGLPTIGLALANFDNNQHAADENISLGHLWDAVDTFAALLTMPK